MKTQDIVTIVSVAIGTAALTVMSLWTTPLEAGDEGATLAPEIARPKLVTRGIELTLTKAGGRAFAAGDEPVFELHAVNTTGEAASTTIRIAMTASSPANALSRVIRLPSVLWQQSQTLALNPNEAKSVVVSTKTKLPANSLISVSLQESDSFDTTTAALAHVQPLLQSAPRPLLGIVAMTFSTIAGATSPVVASAQ